MHKSPEISAGYTASYASGVGPWLGRLGRVADCSRSVGDVLRAPVPRQEFVNALGGLIWQAGQHVSKTISSFSFSDHPRRRLLSTTSSHSTWALHLSLSIGTVLNTSLHLTKWPSAEAYSSCLTFKECLGVRSLLDRTLETLELRGAPSCRTLGEMRPS